MIVSLRRMTKFVSAHYCFSLTFTHHFVEHQDYFKTLWALALALPHLALAIAELAIDCEAADCMVLMR